MTFHAQITKRVRRRKQRSGGTIQQTRYISESQREGNVAWYRNPDRAAPESLGVTYEYGDELKIVRPDFVFFSRQPDGSIAADIVDPHGIQFDDALPKLRGLAKYAEANPSFYRRIESVAKVDDRYRSLNLLDKNVRDAVFSATTAKALYLSAVAADYSV